MRPQSEAPTDSVMSMSDMTRFRGHQATKPTQSRADDPMVVEYLAALDLLPPDSCNLRVDTEAALLRVKRALGMVKSARRAGLPHRRSREQE